MNDAFKKVDVIASPVMPFLPYPIGDLASEFSQDQLEVANYLADLYTVLANTVGVPAIAMPVGFSENKLPIGMQLHGKMFAEQTLLSIAHHNQQETAWHKEVPKV